MPRSASAVGRPAAPLAGGSARAVADAAAGTPASYAKATVFGSQHVVRFVVQFLAPDDVAAFLQACRTDARVDEALFYRLTLRDFPLAAAGAPDPGVTLIATAVQHDADLPPPPPMPLHAPMAATTHLRALAGTWRFRYLRAAALVRRQQRYAAAVTDAHRSLSAHAVHRTVAAALATVANAALVASAPTLLALFTALLATQSWQRRNGSPAVLPNAIVFAPLFLMPLALIGGFAAGALARWQRALGEAGSGTAAPAADAAATPLTGTIWSDASAVLCHPSLSVYGLATCFYEAAWPSPAGGNESRRPFALSPGATALVPAAAPVAAVADAEVAESAAAPAWKPALAVETSGHDRRRLDDDASPAAVGCLPCTRRAAARRIAANMALTEVLPRIGSRQSPSSRVAAVAQLWVDLSRNLQVSFLAALSLLLLAAAPIASFGKLEGLWDITWATALSPVFAALGMWLLLPLSCGRVFTLVPPPPPPPAREGDAQPPPASSPSPLSAYAFLSLVAWAPLTAALALCVARLDGVHIPGSLVLTPFFITNAVLLLVAVGLLFSWFDRDDDEAHRSSGRTLLAGGVVCAGVAVIATPPHVVAAVQEAATGEIPVFTAVLPFAIILAVIAVAIAAYALVRGWQLAVEGPATSRLQALARMPATAADAAAALLQRSTTSASVHRVPMVGIGGGSTSGSASRQRKAARPRILTPGTSGAAVRDAALVALLDDADGDNSSGAIGGAGAMPLAAQRGAGSDDEYHGEAWAVDGGSGKERHRGSTSVASTRSSTTGGDDEGDGDELAAVVSLSSARTPLLAAGM